MFREHPVFAAVFIMFFLQGTVFYNILFGKAYQVGSNFGGLKGEVLKQVRLLLKSQQMLRLNMNANMSLKMRRREEIIRIAKAIPKMGIRVGSFYTLERECTLIFLGYVINQVVSLVIAF